MSVLPSVVPPLLQFVSSALKLRPDPEQANLLSLDPHRCILNCTRQWGKSTITAAKAVHKACSEPGSLTVALSPSARQSGEFVLKARKFLRTINIPAKSDGHNEISISLPNGSRIVGLPSSEDKIRGFSSVSLLLIDEAARVEDSLYQSVRPMLAASDGQFWLLSTPNGRTGFFYKEWSSPSSQWTRFEIPASKCPRISQRFLHEERLMHSHGNFLQEYCCQFLDPDNAVFSFDLLREALSDVPPLPLNPGDCRQGVFLPPTDLHLRTGFDAAARAAGLPRLPAPPLYIIGVDIGQTQDYTAICILERAEIICGPRDHATYEWPRKKLHSVRYLHRIPLGTPYTEITNYICALTNHPSLGSDWKQLVIDGTGVGKPVIDTIRHAKPHAYLHTVILTSGDKGSRSGDTHHLPRKDLLSTLELGLQNHHLTISNHLPLAQTLLDELHSLRRKDTIMPERAADHDDLVFATALAYWRSAWKW